MSTFVEPMRTSIQGLFASSRPATIAGRIGTVVVDAVELMFRRWASFHISEKVDVVIPMRVNRYASAAVIFPIFVFGVTAAVAHGRPNFPFWSASSPITVGGVLPSNSFVFFAPARLHVVASKIACRNDMRIAADAVAKPMGVTSFSVSQRDNGQKIETLADEIFNWVYHPSRYSTQEG